MRARSLSWMLLAAGCLALGCTAAAAAEVKPPLSVQWVYSMGPGARKADPPLVQADKVYVSYGGSLRCLDAVTGAESWKFTPPNGHVTTAPLAYQNLLIVGADDSNVYAVDAKDGKPTWDIGCGGPIGGDPLLLNDLLIVGAQEMVYAITPAGQLKWICSLTAPVSEGPVTDGSMVYFLCQDGSLQSVDASVGRYRWTAMLRTGPNAFAPVVADNRVVVASGSTLVAVSRSGSVSWTAELPAGVGGQPVVVGDTLYVPTVASFLGSTGVVAQISATRVAAGRGEILALYPRSGRAQRAAPLTVSGSATSPPLLQGSTFFVGTGNALVYALDRDTGAVLWVYRCMAPEQAPNEASTSGIYAPIVQADGALYVLTGDGDLYCFSGAGADEAGPVVTDMKPESSDALPGGEPVDVRFTVLDESSGVDPASIQATFDGTPMQVEFEPASGETTFHVRSPKDGAHAVKVTAKDYRGNAGSAQFSFLTDASIKPPPSERTPGSQQRRTGTRGTTRSTQPGGGGQTRGGQIGGRR